ncbi:adenosylmethionine--8-amino-7-oxononanoate transaminase [Sphingobacterium paludis]|uniref:Adenosylmethionine-8-amino-7-oxononanoate aminotransferase n=1 Tax=Sphingobacterium paludis TaxID=1476465 RepID=A0A4R7DDJ5_9SPHI|nr:adenosylmethionine--8-amino-7-oxononanoate transaminase [Sphingobacterium paludis]TDS17216.1 adenosylmethionine-8-amino-7-oxononanoate aminotransferase [Sphingobacterium paludis]
MVDAQQDWIARDHAVNWHPYTQMKTATVIPIVKGEGAYVYDADGKRYIDAVSSWWVTLHGHAHPYIAERVSKQLYQLEQVIFAGFTHPPAIALSERLLQLLPSRQAKAFYSDNGSTAVEVALKMAVQYAYNLGQPKNKILAFRNGYHGDTFGAMSVSARGRWTAPFHDLLFETIFIDVPNQDNIEALKHIVDQHQQQLACFLYEPLVQGAGGMLMHEASYLSSLMAHCRACNVLLIQDEVFVGFGRTGTLFAANQLAEQPDMMCFSKGLTGGTMPLGLTTCTQKIYDVFYHDEKSRALFHGHSFTANPLACTAALASLDLLLLESTQQNIQKISQLHHEFVATVREHRQVRQVRSCGTILAIEWEIGQESSYFSDLQQRLYVFFLEHGILLRPLGNTVYLVPPYSISEEDLRYIYACIIEALKEFQST